jgi:hypothetical protein
MQHFPSSIYSHILKMEATSFSETLRHTSQDSNLKGSISFLSLINICHVFESSGIVNDVTPCSLAIDRLTLLGCDGFNWCWVIPLSWWSVILQRVCDNVVSKRHPSSTTPVVSMQY